MRFFSTLVASTLGTLIGLALISFVGFLFLAALVATTTSPSARSVPSGSVLEIRLSGAVPELASDDPLERLIRVSPPFDLVRLKKGIEKAAQDDRIEGVWIRPGGITASWSTLQEVRSALLAFKTSGKWLVASSGESFMTERDYFLASAADDIYAAPGAFFEFNGLYAQAFYYKGLLDKLGVEPTIVRAGSFKSAVEPFLRDDMSDESRLQLDALLSTHQSVLTRAIAASRDTSERYVESLMQEDAFITAEDAYRAGLLDTLLYDSDVKKRIRESIGTGTDSELSTTRLASYVQSAQSGSSSGRDRIGIVYAVGTILGGDGSPGSGSIGSGTFARAMESVRTDDRVKAVVLRINSPGGSAAAAEAMWQATRRTAEVKPVIVSMGDLAASGGYWIATAGDTIMADPATITGSIGVFGMHFSIGRMLESKLGITADQATTSDYADMFSGLRPLRSVEQAMLARVIDTTYSDFIGLVAERRNMDEDAVHEIAQGRVWSGADAFGLGLVDLLGNLDRAIELAAERAGLEEGSYGTLRVPRPQTLTEQLEEALLMRAGRILGLSEAHAGIRGFRAQADLVEDMIRLHGAPQARMPLDITIR